MYSVVRRSAEPRCDVLNLESVLPTDWRHFHENGLVEQIRPVGTNNAIRTRSFQQQRTFPIAA
ncbi:hypothetical protein SAMN04515647_3882 [Cohaesibacter sp. ES.047]|nr:hypothetical protein SAMN04515647_3882 [Cohaesibacter sp. ES.047]